MQQKGCTPFQDSHLQVGTKSLCGQATFEGTRGERARDLPHRVATRGFLTCGASAPRPALHDHVRLRTSHGAVPKVALEMGFSSQCVPQVSRRGLTHPCSALFSCVVFVSHSPCPSAPAGEAVHSTLEATTGQLVRGLGMLQRAPPRECAEREERA